MLSPSFAWPVQGGTNLRSSGFKCSVKGQSKADEERKEGWLTSRQLSLDLWIHLRSLGTLPSSLRGSPNHKGPPCYRRGLFNLTLATLPGGHIFLPRGDAKAILGTGTQGKPPEAHIPSSWTNPTGPRPSLPSLSYSQPPGRPEQQEWKELPGRSGLWKPRNKASLLCP